MDPGYVLIAEKDPAFRRTKEAEHGLDEGRFARAVGSNEGDHLPFLQVHRDPMENLHLPVTRPEVLCLAQQFYPPRYDSITAGAVFTVFRRPSVVRAPRCITINPSDRVIAPFTVCSM